MEVNGVAETAVGAASAGGYRGQNKVSEKCSVYKGKRYLVSNRTVHRESM